MSIQRTLSILKPDATKRNITGEINAMLEKAGLRIVAQKMIHLSRREAEMFYAEHAQRSFFGELVEFMISEPVIVQALEGDNAVEVYREILGSTNPKEAAAHTVRAKFALNVGENSAHGSDSPESAAKEIGFFFAGREIVGSKA
jgi:nucleoside-diphosphate kinase